MKIGQLVEGVGKAFVFDKIRPGLRNYYMKAGYSEVPYSLFGLLFWLSVLPVAYIFIFHGWDIILSRGFGIILEFIFALLLWAAVHGVVITVVILSLYFFLDLRIFNRTKKMEAVLPDFLRMVSENLKGGMPFERALWSSIRPEFGILANEIRLASKKVITGQNVDEALKSFTEKYDSLILRRSFDLIIEGIKGGGKTADIIDRVIDTIEETKALKEDMAATNLSYVIFVAIIVLVVSPGLFTLSFQFLTVLQNIGARIGGASSGGSATGVSLPIDFGEIAIQPEVFQGFSINALLVIAFVASMMISMIQNGSIKAGVKYIPMLMAGTVFMYLVMMFFATKLFAGFAT